MSKTVTVGWEEFFNKKPKSTPKPMKAWSFVPLVPPNLIETMLWNEFTKPVLLIGGIMIGFTLLDRYLVKHGQTKMAETIETIINMAYPIAVIVALLYLLNKSVILFM